MSSGDALLNSTVVRNRIESSKASAELAVLPELGCHCSVSSGY